MEISIIGAGKMAHGIGTRIIKGRHSLTIYDRNATKAQELANRLGGGTQGVELGTQINGEVVILALPYLAILELVERYKNELAGKIVVDISNPVDFVTFAMIPPADSSGAEQIAALLGSGSRLVKAFNTTLAGTLVAGEVDGKKLDVFVAGDDTEAKKVVKQLADDGGLRGVDVGPLSRAKYLEGFQLIQMSIQGELGTNWMSAIKILP